MRTIDGRAAALVLASLLPLGAGAQQEATNCTRIEEPQARLACYDRVHGRESPPLVVVAPVAPVTPAAARNGPPMPAGAPRGTDYSLATRWDLEGRQGELFAPRAYKPVYLLPGIWTDHVNRQPASPTPGHTSPTLDLRPVEAKYQVSFKSKFAHSLFGTPFSLWGGYTQSSRWQVYNRTDSRPFRETNYEPELIVVAPLDVPFAGGKLRMASLSFNHQSNGRALPLSRSWNRVIGTLAYERGPWTAELRPWVRMPEDGPSDDNPDIADYAGRAEVRVARHWGEHSIALQLRHSLRTGARSHGSAQADYVFPLAGILHGQLQLFNGYAESMIDYNHRQTRIGLGVTIAGWQ